MQAQGKMSAVERDGDGVRVTVILPADRAGDLEAVRAEARDVVTVTIKPSEADLDTAADWIQDRVKKLSDVIGEPTGEIKKRLLRMYGATDVAMGVHYIQAHNLPQLLAVPCPCYKYVPGRDVVNSSGSTWALAVQIKPVKDHEGEELRRLLLGANRMLAEVGLKVYSCSPRLLDFFVTMAGKGVEA